VSLSILLIALLGSASAGGLDRGDLPAGLDEVYAAQRVALLVGVDNYTDPDLTALRFAGKDARDLADVLSGDGNGSFTRVIVLDDAESTTHEGILRAIQFATADLQRDDTFLLYLSGHGTLSIDPVDGSRLWFLPSDGQLAQPQETGLAVDWLEERVGEVPARRRVLIMDTCHNGRDKSSLAPQTARLLENLRGDPPEPMSYREVSESEARLYAAQFYQPAMEDPNLENGVYTHFLIEGLTTESSRADLDGDGLVDVTEAHDWARDHTIEHTGGMQVPRAEYRIVGREEIFLSGNAQLRVRAERALLAAADAVLASGRVLIDGVPRGVLPELIAVEPGVHSVELRDEQDRLIARRRVRFRAGETLMVDTLLAPEAPGWEIGGRFAQRVGPGAGVMHWNSGSLEIRRIHPVLTPGWMETDLHARLGYWRGETEEQGPDVDVASGEFAVGAGVGLKWGTLPVTLGPELDLSVPWRRFEDVAGLHQQSTLTLAPGARLAVRMSLGNHRHLTLDYSARALPYTYAGTWTSMLEHGLSLAVGGQER
jgi:hypothetical protein